METATNRQVVNHFYEAYSNESPSVNVTFGNFGIFKRIHMMWMVLWGQTVRITGTCVLSTSFITKERK